MGFVMKLIDPVIFLFFFIIAVAAPLFDAQSVLPIHIYPNFLVDLSNWYSREYGDYLVAEKPHFFLGLVWLELLFQWPLSLANLYGLLAGKPWFKTTCLVFGVSIFTNMVAILAELLGSQRASDKVLMVYFPFLGLSVLTILRGLLPHSGKTTAIGKRHALIRKKRA